MTWLDVLGWGGSALLVFSLLQTRVLRFRALNLVACLILVVFNALVGVWPMVGMNAVLCAINVWFLVRLLRDRHDDAAFTVVQVRPDDAYLGHLLSVHGADIARFQPEATWAPAAERDHAFVVARGDEAVGVVLLDADAADPGTARVRLDYVTPRFRDFTPGEFLWRRSGAVAALGFRRVVTPPEMVGAYYDRLGFRREGGVWSVDL